jgi:D-sedoheptulose 7-phosphate isomerase
MNQRLEEAFADHLHTIETVRAEMLPRIEAVSAVFIEAFRQGNKVLVMGNGGSAADAQHLAAELVGRFLHDRPSLPAIALTTDTSILTAVGNDYGYDAVFSRQVEGLAKVGDVAVGISTSGNSRNVLTAMEQAKALGCRTVSLGGGDGGALAGLTDHALVVPSRSTPRIQEGHILIIHTLCDLVEQSFL